VAKAEGLAPIQHQPAGYFYWTEVRSNVRYPRSGWFDPSASWEIAGPIIEREEIQLGGYGASRQAEVRDDTKPWVSMWGETSLIAAMRAYVASKLGEEVELP
jgi:hypothetical protein